MFVFAPRPSLLREVVCVHELGAGCRSLDLVAVEAGLASAVDPSDQVERGLDVTDERAACR
jgi:hypothetical protein